MPKTVHELYEKSVTYLDPESILCVVGRLDYIKDMVDQLKNPAILPKRHKITELYILDKHEHLTHRVVETVLASLINDEGVKPFCWPPNFASLSFRLLYL